MRWSWLASGWAARARHAGLGRGQGKKEMARVAQWLLLLLAGLKENGLQLGY
jgi:hypothetical protein